MSSACFASCGNTSETHDPDLPCCAHLNGDLRHLPLVVKKPVFGSAPASVWPSRFCSSGL